MKKVIIILLIFIVPLCLYWALNQHKLPMQTAQAQSGDEVIKFASPMCQECQELDKVFKQIFPKYNKKVVLTKVDVTQRNDNVQALITEYDIRLVPTTVFKNQDGKVTKRIEGSMEPQVLESYLVELINE